MSLKSVKNKIKSIDKTRQVTKAMEAVSAVKMRKSQALAIGTRPYARAALTILRNVSGAIDAARHPLLVERPVKRTLVIVITSDKGLAGSYTSALLKGFYKMLEKRNLSSKNISLITVGKKATDHFLKRGFTVLEHYEKWGDNLPFAAVRPLANRVKQEFLAGDYDRVIMVYTNFLSTLKQEVAVRQLLPVSFDAIEEAVTGIVPEKGKYSELRKEEAGKRIGEYTFEPSPEKILNELIPALFNIHIYHAVLEANASEHSARMIAMKNASDNARDISRALKLKFNKVRQAAITREVSEIVGGMESMKVAE